MLFVKVFWHHKTAVISSCNIPATKTLISTCLAVWHGFGKLITRLRNMLDTIKKASVILTIK
jgi:hypothetical protein